MVDEKDVIYKKGLSEEEKHEIDEKAAEEEREEKDKHTSIKAIGGVAAILVCLLHFGFGFPTLVALPIYVGVGIIGFGLYYFARYLRGDKFRQRSILARALFIFMIIVLFLVVFVAVLVALAAATAVLS